MLSTELHWRTSLTPDGRPEKSDKTPGRTTSKVLEFRQGSTFLIKVLILTEGSLLRVCGVQLSCANIQMFIRLLLTFPKGLARSP